MLKPHHQPSSTSDLVDRQVRLWQARRQSEVQRKRATKDVARPRPLLCVSRQVGAGGEEIGERVAKELALDYWDTRLVHEIAQRADAREALFAFLDEHVQSRVQDFINAFVLPSATDAEYLRHLTNIVHGLEQSGGALIVGRGAQFLLQSGKSLRVRVICPLELRVLRFQQEHDITSAREARRQLVEIERSRHEFNTRSFKGAATDPLLYDVTVNTAELSVSAASAIVVAAYLAKLDSP